MNEKLKNEMTDHLFEAILELKTIEECYNFFEDLCTVREIQELSQRFEVAKLLFEGAKYSDITKKTGASPATISRVNRCLNYGADGYRTVLLRLKQKSRLDDEK
ncbi:TrpR like protein, YerC/YecD [Caldicellulosiruptor acetigenus I77R1B]|jgi:TrpR-related protein YerC/YecD|uniref:TrpR like protein, YerC/YecD n=2 Tax=Caldicellulosiruptor acetigenus TaxID=301953 RepID=G2PYJ1_9FIRM|nr:YerC/YecD family TrpR-related protein [Caldicellulosiruptor acetigenus]ADQ40431.1 TrpR like protein, YerC/YecD [Caldicellulosiruptor acetigenus I77R1B]AEM74041.1 TrpR like protein, YerC/YecD [Caldicellulosiruptor acetigenus 6A]WAM37137.1 YerC/YecD family TrpR-related protein [Caldicellulosiruptor acetigenus]